MPGILQEIAKRAKALVGIKEEGGENRGGDGADGTPGVDTFNKSADLPMGSNWGASMVNYILETVTGQDLSYGTVDEIMKDAQARKAYARKEDLQGGTVKIQAGTLLVMQSRGGGPDAIAVVENVGDRTSVGIDGYATIVTGNRGNQVTRELIKLNDDGTFVADDKRFVGIIDPVKLVPPDAHKRGHDREISQLPKKLDFVIHDRVGGEAHRDYKLGKYEDNVNNLTPAQMQLLLTMGDKEKNILIPLGNKDGGKRIVDNELSGVELNKLYKGTKDFIQSHHLQLPDNLKNIEADGHITPRELADLVGFAKEHDMKPKDIDNAASLQLPVVSVVNRPVGKNTLLDRG